MNTLYKSTVLLIFLFVTTSFSNTTDNWTLYKNYDGVKVYTKVVECESYNKSQSYLVFKYENTTNSPKTINWKLNIWLGENCRSCDLTSPNEYEFNLSLKANETIEGNCKYADDKRFKIYKSSNEARMVPMTKFEFANVIIQ